MPLQPVRMSLDAVMSALEAAGTAQNVKTYRRHGAIEPLFGVSAVVLKALAKRIKQDHALATALWASGNYDAMNFACMIADPSVMTDEEADRWLRSVRCYAASGFFCGVIGRSPVGLSRTRAWIDDPAEYTRATGYNTLAAMLNSGAALDSAWLAWVVDRIERDVGSSANRARYSMNTALIAIGGARPELREAVFAAAGRIGRITVDHGDTGCVTPDIVPYIQRMMARTDR